MAGCCVVMLMLVFLVIGLAAFAAIFGVVLFFLLLGIVLMILAFTVLAKKKDVPKFRGLRIAAIIIGSFSLLIAAAGIILFIATFMAAR